ncbi:unnamed protein product [Protopolystoma xenopodis]|uniref:Uncharacterized protein n=1 Tax=Protopolystoma xenopodis TaxID=117903 RepID=A0A3S5B8E0_9PLAT|nr:unnamed protein product [Protopolystoma xenopodis]
MSTVEGVLARTERSSGLMAQFAYLCPAGDFFIALFTFRLGRRNKLFKALEAGAAEFTAIPALGLSVSQELWYLLCAGIKRVSFIPKTAVAGEKKSG